MLLESNARCNISSWYHLSTRNIDPTISRTNLWNQLWKLQSNKSLLGAQNFINVTFFCMCKKSQFVYMSNHARCSDHDKHATILSHNIAASGENNSVAWPLSTIKWIQLTVNFYVSFLWGIDLQFWAFFESISVELLFLWLISEEEIYDLNLLLKEKIFYLSSKWWSYNKKRTSDFLYPGLWACCFKTTIAEKERVPLQVKIFKLLVRTRGKGFF